MTSPPYWQKREYANGGIGLEKKYEEYIDNLVAICMEVHFLWCFYACWK